ncbi:NAD(P)(+)--arginine ADP-ribosyltransferase, partial [Diplonema papillatum]
MRSAEDAQYYRRMEVVVNRVMMRLMECVLKERPESSKHVLVTISDVIKQNLKASDKVWLCGACAGMNETAAAVCHSCRLGKNEPIPPEEAGDGPLLVALRHDLALREESLGLREQLIAAREHDLGIDTSPVPVAKVKAKSANEVPSRFGDGADLLPSQEKVPDKPVLFPKGYVPLPQASSADGKGVLKFMAAWADPQGKRMWSQETVDDFVSDGDFLVDVSRKRGKSGTEAAMIVRTLYAYTHSQLGPRVLWAVWVPEMEAEDAESKRPPKWEPLFKTSASLEEQYQKHRGTHNGTKTTSPSFALKTVDELAALLMVSEQDLGGSVMIEEHKHLANIDLSVLFGVCPLGKLVIVRYENINRGDLTLSPLRDNVLWIPSGEVLRVSSPLNDDPSCSETPYPGVFEYLASNVPSLALRSSPDAQVCNWTCTPFADDELKSLIEECLAEPNQQKPNKAFHERALELLERDKVTRQGDFPSITRELFAGVFKASCRFDDAVLLTPEEIARSFTMQCVTWYGRHYLLTLSTTTVETRTPHTIGCIETGDVSSVYRVVTSFWPQQIFYLLNMAMRETQFGNPDAMLTIGTSDDKAMLGTAGQYYATQPATWEDGKDVQPAVFSRRDKGLFGTAHLVRLSWCGTEWRIRYPTGVEKGVRGGEARVALKAWMLPQVRPFIFFMNKALDAVQESDDVHATRKTYRGISCSLSRDVYDTGRVLVWAQYSSTSEDQGVAAAFAKGESAAAVFTMHGTTCVPVKPFSRFAREAELLYKNNTCFRVTEALTKEQAQILGKENLQLFTLEEVSETAMYCLLVRRLLPLAKTTAAASVVFQAEAALKGNKCLELSLSHNKVGEVPSKWQVFFHEPTVGCPIEGSSAWNNPMCDEKWLDVFEQARSSMTPVSEDEQPQHLLYASEAPDGRPGTHGVKTIKVSGG